MAWLLTTDGLLQQLDVSEGSPLREAIERTLGSDLISAIPIALGLCMWTSVLSCLDNSGLNAAAMGLADRMADRTDSFLPRMRGDVVITSLDEFGDPIDVSPAALKGLFAMN